LFEVRSKETLTPKQCDKKPNKNNGAEGRVSFVDDTGVGNVGKCREASEKLNKK